MRHDGLHRRLLSFLSQRWHTRAILLLALLLTPILPACQTTTVCNVTGAMILAPALTSGDGVVYAAMDGSLSALGANTGMLAWRKPDGVVLGRPTPPVVAGDIVIVSTGPGQLSAFRRSDGSLAWHSQAVPRLQSGGERLPLPVLALDSSVIYAAASPDSLAAWRVADGTLLWQSPPLEVPADPAYNFSSLPLPEPVVGENVIYFSAGQSVHAVSAADGSLLWSSSALQPANLYTPPTLANGRLFIVAPNSSLYALSADSGAVLWHGPNADTATLPRESSDALPAPPTVRDGVVYYTASDGLRALAVSSGTPLWHLSATSSGTDPSPEVTGGVTYAVANGTLWALDARTGRVRWKATVQQGGEVRFSVLGNAVYTMSSNTVAAWNSSDGTSLWLRTVSVDPFRLGQVFFANDAIYVSTSGMFSCGSPIVPIVSALRTADGTLVWHTAMAAA
jgi:outer membrane protein assembly factor BamB